MPMQSVTVVVLVLSAVAFLVRHAVVSHRKEKQQHSACASCPITKAARPRV